MVTGLPIVRVGMRSRAERLKGSLPGLDVSGCLNKFAGDSCSIGCLSGPSTCGEQGFSEGSGVLGQKPQDLIPHTFLVVCGPDDGG